MPRTPAPASTVLPTVQLLPDLSPGQTVIHAASGLQHQILAILPDGVQLAGCAGLTSPAALEPVLP
jgi:hypothetical protein